jgi:hypothetical protein
MASLPDHSQLFTSAQDFARTALEAQHRSDGVRAAMDAGIALEHLIKACLAKRSPALILELTGARTWPWLLQALDLTEESPTTADNQSRNRPGASDVHHAMPIREPDDLTELQAARCTLARASH